MNTTPERTEARLKSTDDRWAELQTEVANRHQDISRSIEQAQHEFQRISEQGATHDTHNKKY